MKVAMQLYHLCNQGKRFHKKGLTFVNCFLVAFFLKANSCEFLPSCQLVLKEKELATTS